MIQLRHIFFLFGLILSVQSIMAQKVATTEHEKALLDAVKNRGYFEFKTALEKTKSPNITDEYGISLLMYATRRNNTKMVTDLLKAGANANYRINQERKFDDNRNSVKLLLVQYKTVLEFAIDSRDTSTVEMILKAGAKINTKEELFNPLKKASENKDYKMLCFLSKKGAKVSKKTGRDILVLTLNRNASYSYSSIKSKNTNDMYLFKFWEDQGIDISIENLEKSAYFKYNGRSTNKGYYARKIEQYEQWSAKDTPNSDEKVIRSAAYADYIDPEYEAKAKEKARKDSIFDAQINSLRKTSKDWQQEIEEQEERENTSRMMFLYVGAGVLGIMLYVYIKHGSLKTAVWVSILQNIFKKQQQPTNRNRNQNQNNRNQNTTTNPPNPRRRQPAPRTKPQAQAKPTAKPKPAPKPRNTTATTNDKGWTIDTTITTKVELLTIEDMINPIRLCNEHEKAIRKMMWYMRRLENHTDEQIIQVLGEEGLLPHLENLWQNVKITYVRDIYKRSLYLIVEDYQTRDDRVSVFLEILQKKRPRGNKPKK